MDECGEGDLVRKCLGGDAEAFQALAQRYYRPVAAYLFRRLGRSDVVEDLAQETFLQAYRSLRSGTRPQHFSSWLFGIAGNCAGKYLRRRRPVLFDPGAPPGQPAVEPELTAREEQEETQHLLKLLDVELAGLPEETRELLKMKHQGGLTCEQIAAELGRPVGTIKSLLSRTYRLLRDRLRPAGEDGP